MSLTVVVNARSKGAVIRPDIWSGGKPVYCQTTPITGIRMSGKMSVGVRSAASGPIINRSSASTTKVYGRLRAILTRAFISWLPSQTRKKDAGRNDQIRLGEPGSVIIAIPSSSYSLNDGLQHTGFWSGPTLHPLML